mmetsp:Transcript_47249/g.112269  ORF Transcript_47249/g.112269 Transcript_47249/m.112269 type:complete len:241 (+) Transcript_47249:243-965(+)
MVLASRASFDRPRSSRGLAWTSLSGFRPDARSSSTPSMVILLISAPEGSIGITGGKGTDGEPGEAGGVSGSASWRYSMRSMVRIFRESRRPAGLLGIWTLTSLKPFHGVRTNCGRFWETSTSAAAKPWRRRRRRRASASSAGSKASSFFCSFASFGRVAFASMDAATRTISSCSNFRPHFLHIQEAWRKVRRQVWHTQCVSACSGSGSSAVPGVSPLGAELPMAKDDGCCSESSPSTTST